MYEYVPYTYMIKHKETGNFYYGCKYSKNGYTHPDLFWNKNHKKGYFTSSKLIHKMISEYGHDSFEFEIRKTFYDSKSTYEYEQRVLRRVIHWSNCLNAAIGGCYDTNKHRRIKINGISCYDKSSQKMHNTKSIIGIDGLNTYQRSGLKIRGDNNPSKKPENKEKIRNGVNEYIKNLSEEEKERQRNNHRMAMKDQKVREKIKQFNIEKNPARNTFWYNDGIKNYRIYKDDIRIHELNLIEGRIKYNTSYTEYTCPHCKKIGKGANMKSYHFDNCKLKEEQI